eukprot:1178162-Prorocentrum_minimum.AAC.4
MTRRCIQRGNQFIAIQSLDDVHPNEKIDKRITERKGGCGAPHRAALHVAPGAGDSAGGGGQPRPRAAALSLLLRFGPGGGGRWQSTLCAPAPSGTLPLPAGPHLNSATS